MKKIIVIIFIVVFLWIVIIANKNTTTENEVYYTNTDSSVIEVTQPKSGSIVQSPLTIMGRARGGWYFEATFPIVLVDWDGRIIAEGYATAKDNWMTNDLVPFEGIITFNTPETSVSNRGVLIIQKSNASGLPEHDAALEIPIRFNQ